LTDPFAASVVGIVDRDNHRTSCSGTWVMNAGADVTDLVVTSAHCIFEKAILFDLTGAPAVPDPSGKLDLDNPKQIQVHYRLPDSKVTVYYNVKPFGNSNVVRCTANARLSTVTGAAACDLAVIRVTRGGSPHFRRLGSSAVPEADEILQFMGFPRGRIHPPFNFRHHAVREQPLWVDAFYESSSVWTAHLPVENMTPQLVGGALLTARCMYCDARPPTPLDDSVAFSGFSGSGAWLPDRIGGQLVAVLQGQTSGKKLRLAMISAEFIQVVNRLGAA
jgi:hypothetical protein